MRRMALAMCGVLALAVGIGAGTATAKQYAGNDRCRSGDDDRALASSSSPVAVDDTAAAMDDDGTSILNVLANDRSRDCRSLRITAIGGNPLGLVSIVDGGRAISYDPNGNVEPPGTNVISGSTTDTFTYTITDKHGATSTATVTVVVWYAGVDYTALCIPLTLSAPTVSRGHALTASGTSINGGVTILVVLDGRKVLATTQSDGNHFWSVSFKIPRKTSRGTHTLQGVQPLTPTQPRGCPNQTATFDVT